MFRMVNYRHTAPLASGSKMSRHISARDDGVRSIVTENTYVQMIVGFILSFFCFFVLVRLVPVHQDFIGMGVGRN
jgi:hypothetical protein